MENFGWDVIREMNPDHTDYRADIVATHERFGWLGIETKYLAGCNYGRDIAHAHRQIIKQYRGRRYLGNDVDLWAVCAYPSHVSDLSTWSAPRMREFLNVYGIGWVNINPWRLEADFAYSDVSKKIPLAALRDPIPGDRIMDTDVDSVRQAVEGKVKR